MEQITHTLQIEETGKVVNIGHLRGDPDDDMVAIELCRKLQKLVDEKQIKEGSINVNISNGKVIEVDMDEYPKDHAKQALHILGL